MAGFLSLPDELITHILVLGGHLIAMACQQARIFPWRDTSDRKLMIYGAVDMSSLVRPRERFNGLAICAIVGSCRPGRQYPYEHELGRAREALGSP
jgi:hypothetical protein